MIVKIEKGMKRVIVLDISGIYCQIYDEIYCSNERYKNILEEFGVSDKYKVVLI